MSRPRRSEHVREALIQAGIEQISSHGYHGTGIKQILDEVKVPKGSFYNFFASKEAFVAEIISVYSEDMQRQLHEFVQGAGKAMGIKQQLRAIGEYALQTIAKSDFQHSCLIGSLAVEIGAGSEECRVQLQRAAGKWIAFFAERFQVGQETGEIRKDLTAAQLADVYWASWEGVLARVQMSKQTQPALETMDVVLNTLMAPNT